MNDLEDDPVRIFDKCREFTRARELMAAGIYPYFRAIQDNEARAVVIGGRRVIMVGSNNYLGLTQDPRVKEAARAAIERYGSGCTGSRFLNGTLDLHVELEDRLARFTRREAALTFSTGFQVNLGVIATLAGRDDVILCDRENHASIFDGCRLSFARVLKYRHNDMEHLASLLDEIPRGTGILVVTDGVFSMRGDLCNLPRIVELAEAHGAAVMVDDAHGIGVMGANGRGTAEHFGLEDRVDLVMGTFSKSLASLGGFIAGREEVVHYVRHHARSLIFSAAITPASAAAALAALDVVEREPERRARLWENARRLREGFHAIGLDTCGTESVIVPVLVGDDTSTFRAWKAVFDEGVFTNPVVAPATPPGEGLLRTSTMATHSEADLGAVIDVFARVAPAQGLVRRRPLAAGDAR